MISPRIVSHGENLPKERGFVAILRNQGLPLGDKAFFVLLALVVVVVLFTFRDYGYSWDEAWQNRWYGEAVIRFITSLGHDRSAITEFDFSLYGGTFDVFAELLVKLSPLEPRNARHLANALAGLAGLCGCWRTARWVGGPSAGFWAALFLVLSAPFYGHIFINAKDIPFAAGYIWSLYFLLKIIPQLPSPSLKDRLLLGLTLGLMLGVRIGGLLIIFFALLIVGGEVLAMMSRRVNWQEIRHWSGRALLAGFPVILLAWVLMLIFWPAALLKPLATPWAAFTAASHFQWDGKVLWCGQELSAMQLPWNYLPVIFAVTLPEALVLLLFMTISWSIVRLYKGIRHGNGPFMRGLAVLFLAVIFPTIWAIINKSTLYDNGRHFLFLLPPFFCLAACAWQDFLTFINKQFCNGKFILQILMLLVLFPCISRMADLHPYEYAFLNLFAGGMPAGAAKFDTDYWATSYREATFPLIAHARKVAKEKNIPFDSMNFTLLVVGSIETVRDSLPRNFTLYDVYNYKSSIPTDYFLSTTRWHADSQLANWPIVSAVERLGMPFAVVKVEPGLMRSIPWEGQ